ncbi:MAG: alkaline phosphatase [Ezakiella sp.]|nr:alkaline phosphatase [Ezakiella sp.]
MKRLSILLVIAMLFTFAIPSFAEEAKTEEKAENAIIKNVIIMIPDGMGVEGYTLARWFAPEGKFHLDDIATGFVRTNNADTPLADSAPAATAMATGYKSNTPYIGVYPAKAGMPGTEGFDEAKADMPLATLLEAAERTGRSTGIVSTSNVNHATPAAFSSHHPSRKELDTLIEQQIYQNMEVVLGAGSNYLEADKRKDGEDLLSEVKALGYDYFTTRDELLASKGEKIFGMFQGGAMNYDLDRDEKTEPSLEDMTRKAIEVLSKNEEGFFLVVEGSEIDWAAHANDPVGLVTDILAYDKAVKVALDFAKTNSDTVIISAADHCTGGPTMGNFATSGSYYKTPLENFIKIIKNAKKTGFGAGNELNKDRSNIAEIMNKYFGINDLTAGEIKHIKETEDPQQGIGQVISERSFIGWTSNGHVGGDTGLYCYSSNPTVAPLSGTVFNHEIAKYVEKIMGVDLDALTEKLFIVARPALEAKGAKVEWKNVGGDKPNHELIATKDGKTYRFPVNKNYAYVGEEKVTFDGLTVFNGKAAYLPQSAINLVK